MTGRYLLDTNTLIWAVDNRTGRMSPRQADIVARSEGLVVSIVSFWEIAIKQSLGKLRIDGDVEQVVRGSMIDILPISLAHAAHLRSLPFHHRDPFDRMLVAQATIEDLELVTSDRKFGAYDVAVV